MISKGLPQRVSGHLIAKTKIGSDAFENVVSSLSSERSVCVLVAIALAPEHVVTELDSWCIGQIKSYGFDYSFIDSDATVLSVLPCVLRLLFQNVEAITERAVIINDIGEPDLQKVADTESEVNANDEEHVVSVSSLVDKVLGYTDDVIHVLDWFRCVFSC